MSNYLREQSAGEILRATIKIYRQNFLTLCGMYLLLVVPFQVLNRNLLEGVSSETAGVFLLIAIKLLVVPFATAALAVGVSDVCVGNRPSIVRSLRRVFGSIFGKLILTNFFMLLITAVACIPGVVFGLNLIEKSCGVAIAGLVLSLALIVLFRVWWMFVPTIVVLERTFGWAPLVRSRLLGKGYYLRNLGIIFILYFATLIIWGLVFFVSLYERKNILIVIPAAIAAEILTPLPLIATVLLYYDLRVRSEGYDLMALGQDLRR